MRAQSSGNIPTVIQLGTTLERSNISAQVIASSAPKQQWLKYGAVMYLLGLLEIQ
jgi:hypothetical protein